MKDGTKILLTIALGFLIYPIICIITLFVSFSKGFSPLNCQIYFEGVTEIVVSIIILGIVIVCCTYEIVNAINKKI